MIFIKIHCILWKKEEEFQLLGPWHPWGGQRILRLTPKLDPLIYDRF
jgi:hypothetical protein